MNLLVTYVIEVIKAYILKLLLDSLHTETVRERRVNVHSLKRYCSLSVFLLRRKRTHVMESVAELYKDNSDILVHGKKHFSDIFYMCFFLIGNLNLNYLCKSINEHSNLLTKHFGQKLKARFIRAILYRVVQKCGTNGICIETKLGDDARHRYRMAYIGLAAESELSLVKTCRIIISFGYLLDIIISFAALK